MKLMTTADLRTLEARDIPLEYEYFWTTVSPFSQFHRKSFIVNDIEFTCAEQYMMYSKAMHFKDYEIAEKILAIPYPEGTEYTTPKQYKALGRQVKNFNDLEWARASLQYVYRGNAAKFTQDNEYCDILCSTHPKILVEASPYDKIWGIGLKETDPRAASPANWNGQNKLGFILTQLREDIIDGTLSKIQK